MCPKPPDPKNPRDPLGNPFFSRDDLEDLFEGHFPYGRSETGFVAGRGFRPHTDLYEVEDGLVIEMDIPGVNREQVDIKVDGNRLIVYGSRDFVRERPGEEIIRLERGFGSFRRIFEIPADSDENNITARLESGVLVIKVPRITGTRKIKVEIEED